MPGLTTNNRIWYSPPMQTHDSDALIVVDVQNDFCPGGALAIRDGDAVVPVINRLARAFKHVIITQDWHPAGHMSFASQHPGKKPYESFISAYGPQELWPDHCVQNTPGAAFHRDLDIPHAELILRKGADRKIDSYSAFIENDQDTKTGLAAYLHERGVARLFLAGLAYDFCVLYSAADGRREGFVCHVVADGCRSVDVNGSRAAADERYADSQVTMLSSDDFETL